MLGKSLLAGLCIMAVTSVGVCADLRVADAAMHGNKDGVRALLKQKVGVNDAQGDGMTALHWAVFNEDLEMARLLVQAGAKVNTVTRVDALTPLYLAATNGNGAMINLLLAAGASANDTNTLGTTALMQAAASGRLEAIETLLSHGANVNARESAREQTALMFASALNRDGVIKVLAAHGADLKAVSKVVPIEKPAFDEDGNPLPAKNVASRTGTVGTVAAPQAPGGASVTVMGGLTALHYAAREGRMDAVRTLIDVGVDVNQVSAGDKSSPMVIAIVNGHFDIAKYLLDHGADAKLATIDNLTPLYATLECQWAPVAWTPTASTAAAGTAQQKVTYLDLMTALLDRGADPNVKINRPLWFSPPHHDQLWVKAGGATPFWRASQATDVAAMKLLIARGADPKLMSMNKDSALHMAAGVGWAGNFSTNAPDAFMPSVKYLVEDLGVDLNAADSGGYTPVMGAAYRGDNEMVQYLVSKGARVDARTGRGWSVTDMANAPSLRSSVPLAHPETIALLRQLGAPEPTKVEDEEILGIIKRKIPVPDTPKKP